MCGGAFTLAEVLISLVIIGVIAALTIPALKSSSSNEEYINAYKKLYSTLGQFHIKVKTDNGGYLDNLFSNEETTYKTFTQYFLSAHTCRVGENADVCFPKYAQATVASSPNYQPTNPLSLILNDGTIMIFNCFCADCTNNTELNQAIGCVRIRADINGLKKPNKAGKDIFGFYITEERIIPRGDPSTTTTPDASSGFGKGYKILTTGKLN